jgi:hypothetical protein
LNDNDIIEQFNPNNAVENEDKKKVASKFASIVFIPTKTEAQKWLN